MRGGEATCSLSRCKIEWNMSSTQSGHRKRLAVLPGRLLVLPITPLCTDLCVPLLPLWSGAPCAFTESHGGGNCCVATPTLTLLRHLWVWWEAEGAKSPSSFPCCSCLRRPWRPPFAWAGVLGGVLEKYLHLWCPSLHWFAGAEVLFGSVGACLHGPRPRLPYSVSMVVNSRPLLSICQTVHLGRCLVAALLPAVESLGGVPDWGRGSDSVLAVAWVWEVYQWIVIISPFLFLLPSFLPIFQIKKISQTTVKKF